MLRSTPGSIRTATDDDLPLILTWLKEQQSQDEEDTFLCNWNLTERAHEEGDLLVYIEAGSNAPVAYFWGSLNDTSSILEVKASHRRHGIGAHFVEHLIGLSHANNEPLLHIECAPESSVAFWTRMGFEVYSNRRLQWFGTQILPMPRELPKDGMPIEVSIKFLDERSHYGDAAPISVHAPRAVQMPDGLIHLDRRIAEFCPSNFNTGRELFIEITVGGQAASTFVDKCKYSSSEAVGVEACKNGYAIERICPAAFDQQLP